jgi:hypothetical protein
MAPARRSLPSWALLLALLLLDVYVVRTEATDVSVREPAACSISSLSAPLETARDRLVSSLLRAEMATPNQDPRGDDDIQSAQLTSEAHGLIVAPVSDLAPSFGPRLRHPGQSLLCVWLV